MKKKEIETNKLSYHLGVRLTARDGELLHKIASKELMQPSSYVRRIVLAELYRKAKQNS